MILHTMNKISIKESVLMACIIEAIQASLFDDGVSPEQEELYNKKKIARQNAAKKAAQTRSVNKQNKEKATDLITIKTLGLAYLEEFKLDEAEKEFLKFIDLVPKDKFGYANLGLVYLRMGKYPEAEKQLLKAIKAPAIKTEKP